MSPVVVPTSSHLCFPTLVSLSKLDLGKAPSSWTQSSKSTLPPYHDYSHNQATYQPDVRTKQTLGQTDTMSTAYHVSHPHPRALYEPLGGYSHPPMRARPVLPDPYDTRALAPEPASIRYTTSHGHHSQQLLQQLPQLPQPVIRPTVTIPAPTTSASTTTSALYQSSHSRTSQTVSPSRSFTSQVEREAPKSTAEMLMQSSTCVPACINPNGGTMADLAADMTCLFWFESVEVIRAAKNCQARSSPTAIPPLTPLAHPDPGFKKWVTSILSTTQVTQNVIVLALLFIYRLKMINPQVRGRSGSEYRLLTVALMLGNKFLDDNTYTNKTWAEVSHIQVTEIHVMEVEFLSNMRYNLFVDAEEWDRWLVQLASFVQYCQRSGEKRLPSPAIPVQPPAHSVFSSPLPSPTNLMASASLPTRPSVSVGAYQPTHVLPNPMMSSTRTPHYHAASSPLSIQYSPSSRLTRKRSVEEDDDSIDHPAKRVARVMGPSVIMPPLGNMQANSAEQHQQQHQQHHQQHYHSHQQQQPAPRIAMPQRVAHLPAVEPAYSPTFVPSGALAYGSQASLPPLHGPRAMSTVYHSGPQQVSAPAASAPAMASGSYAATADGPNGYRTPTKHHSPAGLGIYASSPMVESYPPMATLHTPAGHTPNTHSPITYLQDRSSPYKPIRHVNELLRPSFSGSLQDYHLSQLAPSQMHYQPIGRRHDLRTGVVPDFVLTPPALNYHQHHQPLVHHHRIPYVQQ